MFMFIVFYFCYLLMTLLRHFAIKRLQSDLQYVYMTQRSVEFPFIAIIPQSKWPRVALLIRVLSRGQIELLEIIF